MQRSEQSFTCTTVRLLSSCWLTIATLVTGAVPLSACHDAAPAPACVEGTEGCPCAGDRFCDGGLVCEASTCVAAPTPPDTTIPDVAVVEVLGQDVASDAILEASDARGPTCGQSPFADLCACRQNADCASGYCLPSSAGGSVCTNTCDETCPSGFQCLFVTLPGLDPTYLCVEPDLNLCRPCTDDLEC